PTHRLAPTLLSEVRKNRSSWRCASSFEWTVTGGSRGSEIWNSLSSPTLKHTLSAGRSVVQCVVTMSPVVWESARRPILARRERCDVWNVRSTSVGCSPYRGNQSYELLTKYHRSSDVWNCELTSS